MSIVLRRPTIKRQEMASVLNTLVSDNIYAGELSSKLSRTVAHYLEKKDGVSLPDYYSAISLAFDILGLQSGDRVIIGALSSRIYLEVMEERGIEGIIVDVDTHTGLPREAELEEKLMEGGDGENCKAVVIDYGYCPSSSIKKGLLEGVSVIEDISHVLGSETGGTKLGSDGDIAILHTDVSGNITTGEGAIVSVKDGRLVREMRRILKANMKYSLMSDLNAALGLSQLKNYEDQIELREDICEKFLKKLSATRHGTPICDNSGHAVCSSFPIVIADGLGEVERFVKKYKIETELAYSDSIVAREPRLRDSMENAWGLFLRTMLFPLYPMLTVKEVELLERVISSLP